MTTASAVLASTEPSATGAPSATNTNPAPEPPNSAAAPAPKAEQPAALLLNSIIKRCCTAYEETLAAEMAKAAAARQGSYERASAESDARKKAVAAYLEAMPFLTAPIAIRAYIACVANAMMRDLITEKKGAKLLYAAQMARAGMPQSPRSPGRPPKEKPLPEN